MNKLKEIAQMSRVKSTKVVTLKTSMYVGETEFKLKNIRLYSTNNQLLHLQQDSK